jgi:protein gp37
MTKSKIEWTDRVWNPVTGCTKVSPGCAHCYAERLFPRTYPGRDFGDVQLHEDRLEAPLRWRKPARVFVNSMSDLFHEDVPVTFISKVLVTMAKASKHTFVVLTKRPKRARTILSGKDLHLAPITIPNVILGVSVEDQLRAAERIPLLLEAWGGLKCVSCEPLLGPVTLQPWLDKIDWVIVGGESGPKARHCNVAWIRALKDECVAGLAPVFIKQLGSRPELPAPASCALLLKHTKGGDPDEWPEDLRIREYP